MIERLLWGDEPNKGVMWKKGNFSLSLFSLHIIFPFDSPRRGVSTTHRPARLLHAPRGREISTGSRLPKNTHGPRVRGPAEESICTTLFALSSPMDLEDDERYAAAALYTLALHLVQV